MHSPQPLEEDPDIVVIPVSTFLLTKQHVQDSIDAAGEGSRRRREMLNLGGGQRLGRNSSDDDAHDRRHDPLDKESFAVAPESSSPPCQATRSPGAAVHASRSKPPAARSKSSELLEKLQQELTLLKLQQELASLQKLQASQCSSVTPAQSEGQIASTTGGSSAGQDSVGVGRSAKPVSFQANRSVPSVEDQFLRTTSTDHSNDNGPLGSFVETTQTERDCSSRPIGQIVCSSNHMHISSLSSLLEGTPPKEDRPESPAGPPHPDGKVQ